RARALFLVRATFSLSPLSHQHFHFFGVTSKGNRRRCRQDRARHRCTRRVLIRRRHRRCVRPPFVEFARASPPSYINHQHRASLAPYLSQHQSHRHHVFRSLLNPSPPPSQLLLSAIWIQETKPLSKDLV